MGRALSDWAKDWYLGSVLVFQRQTVNNKGQTDAPWSSRIAHIHFRAVILSTPGFPAEILFLQVRGWLSRAGSSSGKCNSLPWLAVGTGRAVREKSMWILEHLSTALGVQFGTGKGVIMLELLWGPRRLQHKSLQELDLCSFYVWNINRFLIYWHKIKWTSATSGRKIDFARRTGKYTGGVLHCSGKVVWGSGWVKHRLHSLEDLWAVVKSCLEE